MGLARAGAEAGSLLGEAGKDLRPGTAEVTEEKLSGENNGHALLNSPTVFLKKVFLPGTFFKETMLRRHEWFGFWQV